MAADVRVREYLKMGLRHALRRCDLDLVRHPYPNRLATTMRWLGVETVLDVGANIGQFASSLRAAGYEGRIVSCEPLADAFAHLERRAARDPKWDVVRTAVGAQAGTTEIHVSANSYSSSLRPATPAHLHAAPDSRIVRRESVDVTTVADLAERWSIRPDASMLKVDTQGHESDVLDGAGSALPMFGAIQLELSFVPLYEGQDLFWALTQRLRDAGFELYGIEPGIGDPKTGRLLQSDGLFVAAGRDPGGPEVGA